MSEPIKMSTPSPASRGRLNPAVLAVYNAPLNHAGDQHHQMNYYCGICNASALFNNIAQHSCLVGFNHFCLDGNKFYPVQDENMDNNSENSAAASLLQVSTGKKIDVKKEHIIWTDAKIEELIQNVQDRPALWNFTIPLKERNKDRNRMWEEVSTVLGGAITPTEARSKWKNLVDVFRRQCNQAQQQSRSGAATSKKTKWIFYDSLLFLKHVDLSTQKTESNSAALTSSDDEVEAASSDRSKKPRRKSKEHLLEKMVEAFSKESEPFVIPPLPPADEIRSICILVDSKLRALSEEARQQKIKELLALFY